MMFNYHLICAVALYQVDINLTYFVSMAEDGEKIRVLKEEMRGESIEIFPWSVPQTVCWMTILWFVQTVTLHTVAAGSLFGKGLWPMEKTCSALVEKRWSLPRSLILPPFIHLYCSVIHLLQRNPTLAWCLMVSPLKIIALKYKSSVRSIDRMKWFSKLEFV